MFPTSSLSARLGSARLGNLSESPAEHQCFFFNGPELEAATKKSFVAKGRHGPHGALLGTMPLSFLLLFLPLPCAAGYLLPAERERRKTAVTRVAGGTKGADQARIYMEVKWRPRMWMWRAGDNKKARGRDGWRLSEIANKKKEEKNSIWNGGNGRDGKKKATLPSKWPSIWRLKLRSFHLRQRRWTWRTGHGAA